ncbi:hypothetical protein GY980_24135 [Escherichia coli]|nr:hypothetical protein [Escherichia coli]
MTGQPSLSDHQKDAAFQSQLRRQEQKLQFDLDRDLELERARTSYAQQAIRGFPHEG